MARGADRRTPTVVCLATAALLVTGCDTGDTGGRVNHQDAGSVAVAYADALFNGKTERGESLVDPTALRAYRVLAKVVVPATTRAEHLRPGTVQVDGVKAKVTLLGTLCSAGGPGGATGEPTCQTSDDPDSSVPGLQVNLVKEGRDWFVYYPS
ncbi:hypothetical protein [Streptomyces sp. NPDC003717]|uniref:hypothetical protein n=1 Tax=Streptomyces sp. NPDC003717 TaxID=3154276 RepID=UPI0033BA7450